MKKKILATAFCALSMASFGAVKGTENSAAMSVQINGTVKKAESILVVDIVKVSDAGTHTKESLRDLKSLTLQMPTAYAMTNAPAVEANAEFEVYKEDGSVLIEDGKTLSAAFSNGQKTLATAVKAIADQSIELGNLTSTLTFQDVTNKELKKAEGSIVVSMVPKADANIATEQHYTVSDVIKFEVK